MRKNMKKPKKERKRREKETTHKIGEKKKWMTCRGASRRDMDRPPKKIHRG
jgi:hypothetical protein